jgi:hypothetical protein
MPLSSRLRYGLARRPWIYWALVTGVALIAAVTVTEPSRRAEDQRNRWGHTTVVAVATRTIDIGERFHGAVELRRYPIAMVPAEALDEVGRQATARRRLPSGQILTVGDIADDARPESLAERGQVILAVVEQVPSGPQLGDQVMITSEGLVLSELAVVVGTHQSAVLLAVDRAVAPMVAAAAASNPGLSLLRIP